MAKPPHSLPTLLAAALVGGAAGFFAAHATIRPAAPTPATDPAAGAAMLAELRGLRTELRALATSAATGELTTPTPQPSNEREAVVAAAPGGDGEVLAELQRLRARIDRIGTQRAAQDGVLRQLAASRVRDEQALMSLVAMREADFDRAQQEAFLLTMAEVLQRYGKPDRATPTESGVRWEYEFSTGDDRQWLGLTFVDGVVVFVQ